MTLDQVYMLIWQRRLERLFTISLPVIPAIILLTVFTGVFSYLGLSNTLGIFADFDTTIRVEFAFKIGTLIVLVPLALASLLLSKTNGNLNEAALSLPYSQTTWAKVLIKYHYLSLLPIMIGVIGAFISVVVAKYHLHSQTLLLLVSYLALFGCAGLFFSYYVSQYIFVIRSNSLKRFAMFFPLLTIGSVSIVLLRYAKITLSTDEILLPSATVALWVLCAGLMAICGSYARRLLLNLQGNAPTYKMNLRNRSTKSVRRLISSRSRNVLVVLLLCLLRDFQIWVLYFVVMLLSGGLVLLARWKDNSSFTSLLLGTLPMLLITVCMVVLGSVRAGLGSQRNSIYALPISKVKVSLSLILLTWLFICATLTCVVGGAHWILHYNFEYSLIIQLLLLGTLASLLACVTSVLFFETKKDVTKGLMSSIVAFLVASPLYMLDGWLKSKTLVVYGIVTVSIIVVVIVTILIAEQRLTAREYA